MADLRKSGRPVTAGTGKASCDRICFGRARVLPDMWSRRTQEDAAGPLAGSLLGFPGAGLRRIHVTIDQERGGRAGKKGGDELLQMELSAFGRGIALPFWKGRTTRKAGRSIPHKFAPNKGSSDWVTLKEGHQTKADSNHQGKTKPRKRNEKSRHIASVCRFFVSGILSACFFCAEQRHGIHRFLQCRHLQVSIALIHI